MKTNVREFCTLLNFSFSSSHFLSNSASSGNKQIEERIVNANIARNTGKRKASKNGCRNGGFIQKMLGLSVLCITLVSIANIIQGAEHSSAEEKEVESSANPSECIDGAALFASILLMFGCLSASVFAKSNRIVTLS